MTSPQGDNTCFPSTVFVGTAGRVWSAGRHCCMGESSQSRCAAAMAEASSPGTFSSFLWMMRSTERVMMATSMSSWCNMGHVG